MRLRSSKVSAESAEIPAAKVLLWQREVTAAAPPRWQQLLASEHLRQNVAEHQG
ncbi:hypothetical protein BH20ACI3_BH20ACI3_34450 [soil metagenome]